MPDPAREIDPLRFESSVDAGTEYPLLYKIPDSTIVAIRNLGTGTLFLNGKGVSSKVGPNCTQIFSGSADWTVRLDAGGQQVTTRFAFDCIS